MRGLRAVLICFPVYFFGLILSAQDAALENQPITAESLESKILGDLVLPVAGAFYGKGLEIIDEFFENHLIDPKSPFSRHLRQLQVAFLYQSMEPVTAMSMTFRYGSGVSDPLTCQDYVLETTNQLLQAESWFWKFQFRASLDTLRSTIEYAGAESGLRSTCSAEYADFILVMLKIILASRLEQLEKFEKADEEIDELLAFADKSGWTRVRNRAYGRAAQIVFLRDRERYHRYKAQKPQGIVKASQQSPEYSSFQSLTVDLLLVISVH